jgi:hypothetical protein
VWELYAALKRRSSTLLPHFRVFPQPVKLCPSRFVVGDTEWL